MIEKTYRMLAKKAEKQYLQLTYKLCEIAQVLI